LKIFQATSTDDLFANVGAGLHSAHEVFNAVFPGHKQTERDEKTGLPTVRPNQSPRARTSRCRSAPDSGHGRSLRRCCHPLPATASSASSPPAKA